MIASTQDEKKVLRSSDSSGLIRNSVKFA